MDNTSPPHSPYSFTVVSSPLDDNYSPRTSTYHRHGYITLIDSESEAEDEEDDEDENTDDKIAWGDVIPVSNPEITVNDEEKDAVGDGEQYSDSDAEDAVNDTAEDSVNDTVHPLNGHIDGKLDQSDINNSKLIMPRSSISSSE
ncbi:unnamed protein product [Clonostachys rosea f. rosea IK726]|uniref:Uncharacterized protein n=1 Tax=Clonostachys rosea f. rosea IK726 TaxID=1349383 RepID=A0ACA9U7V2_BIOOC|nr:unnamed protein product [Clonostachys rosea f. rosea IK726]